MLNMDMPLRVLLAIDDSPVSTATASFVTQISWPADTILHLLNLPEPLLYAETIRNEQSVGGVVGGFSNHSTTRMRSAQIAQQLKQYNLAVTMETESGQSSDRILSRATALTPDIIAVGLDKSLVHSLLYRLKSSLLMIRPSKSVRPLSTLVVVDDSPASTATLDLLCRLSLPNWAKVTLLSLVQADQKMLAGGGGPTRRYVSTVEPPCHTCRAIGRLEECGVRVWRDRRSDGSVNGIVATAQQEKSSLIVIGWSEDNTKFIEQVVEDAPCSVLVVR